MIQAITIILGLLLAYTIKRLLEIPKQPAPYPPGPKGWPIIGNALDFPTVETSQTYARWGIQYGSDILHGSAFGTHVVILNKLKDADELFERRAAKYSDRPQYPIMDMIDFSYNVGFMEYGDNWRWCRKICQQAFRQAALSERINSQIETKVYEALIGMLRTPEYFEDHNRMLSISIPMSTMYGYDVQSFEDPCISAADESTKLVVQLLTPGGSIMNILPIFRYVPIWFPGAISQRMVQRTRLKSEEMKTIPINFVKSQLASYAPISKGVAKPSLVSNFFEKKATVGASEDEEKAILCIAPTVYGGASDTTLSATGTFLYLMAVNIDVQRKAQAEIDRVIGGQRLPTFEDRPMMPYIEAIYREVLRWQPPVPLSIPHAVSEDDMYNGYFIPKGATIIGNIWAMAHDETVYPDPYTFKPERFINPDGSLNKDDHILAFGFGRRVCVGKHVGSATVWFTFVSFLAAFNIGKAHDKSGKEIEIDPGFENFGLLAQKKPFKCSITPRSDIVPQLLEQANVRAA